VLGQEAALQLRVKMVALLYISTAYVEILLQTMVKNAAEVDGQMGLSRLLKF